MSILDPKPLTLAAGNATYATVASPTFTGTVTGVTKAMVGLSNADNTADSAKPVSAAQQAALDLKPSKVSFGFVYATDYGVTANGATDDTAAMQSFINYIVTNSCIGILPAGTIKLTAKLNIQQRPGWSLLGAGSEKTILSQATDNIPILDLGQSAGPALHTYGLRSIRFTYANVQPAANTNAIPILYSCETYWGNYNDLVFVRGFFAFKVASGIGGPWGSIWDNVRCGSEISGGVMDWSLCINGVPNNHFGRIFLDGSNMIGPIFSIRGYNFTIDTIEFAAVGQGAQLMVCAPSTRVEVGTFKLENGYYGAGFSGKALVELQGNAYMNLGNMHVGGNNLVMDMLGLKCYMFSVNSGAGGGGYLRVEFIDALWTTRSGNSYIANPGSLARGIDIGGVLLDTKWDLTDSTSGTAQNRTRLLSASNGRVSLDRGDANITLTVGNENIQMFNTPFTAPRTLTLPSSGAAFNGLEYRIVSAGAVNGANTLTVKSGSTTLATLTADNTSVRIGYRRTNSLDWVVIP